MQQDLEKRVRDLEFLLRRESIESKKRVREVLYQVLDVQDGLERLLAIATREEWPGEVKKFVNERFALVSKRLVQLVLRSGAIAINSLGHPFNCEYHEMLAKAYNPDVPEGQIVEVKKDGYIYEGEVLQMAQVIVATSEREQ